jgi:aspartate carbamoyltransferase regulatory subunit
MWTLHKREVMEGKVSKVATHITQIVLYNKHIEYNKSMLNMVAFFWWKYFECKCEPCTTNKQHRIQKVITHRTQNVLDPIHCDICEMDKHTHKRYNY